MQQSPAHVWQQYANDANQEAGHYNQCKQKPNYLTHFQHFKRKKDKTIRIDYPFGSHKRDHRCRKQIIIELGDLAPRTQEQHLPRNQVTIFSETYPT